MTTRHAYNPNAIGGCNDCEGYPTGRLIDPVGGVCSCGSVAAIEMLPPGREPFFVCTGCGSEIEPDLCSTCGSAETIELVQGDQAITVCAQCGSDQ